jgi:hypothetical protein
LGEKHFQREGKQIKWAPPVLGAAQDGLGATPSTGSAKPMTTGWKFLEERFNAMDPASPNNSLKLARIHAANPLSRTTLLAVQLNFIR